MRRIGAWTPGRTRRIAVWVCFTGALLPLPTLSASQQDPTQVPVEQTPVEPDVKVGILLGDSVVHGFGHAPVLYNESPTFSGADRYKFRPQLDAPVERLAGFKGIDLWLNRGVMGSTSQGALDRWSRDVMERQERGAQKLNYRPDWVLVSVGMTDIGAAIGTPRLRKAEANLRRNMLALLKRSREAGIHMTFLELPDPTRAPLGQAFTNTVGERVPNFCESHEYSDEDCREFTASVGRIRGFMEKSLPLGGATVIDYAMVLPTEYFLDSFHPTQAGYDELGRRLRERYPF